MKFNIMSPVSQIEFLSWIVPCKVYKVRPYPIWNKLPRDCGGDPVNYFDPAGLEMIPLLVSNVPLDGKGDIPTGMKGIVCEYGCYDTETGQYYEWYTPSSMGTTLFGDCNPDLYYYGPDLYCIDTLYPFTETTNYSGIYTKTETVYKRRYVPIDNSTMWQGPSYTAPYFPPKDTTTPMKPKPVGEAYSFTEMRIDTDGITPNGKEKYGKNHQSQTSILNGTLDAEKNHYVVLPGGYTGKAKLGDVAVVIDHKTGRYVYAVIADTGPKGTKPGEVSISVCWDLGYKSNGFYGPTGNFEVIFYPGSSISWTKDTGALNKQIDTIGRNYY